MILFLVLAVLLPWSLWRQMQVHEVTRESLVKLPLIFAGIGVVCQWGTPIPHSSGALLALAISIGASVALGVWRGEVMPLWRGENGAWMSQGNRQTLTLWIALIVFKFALGTVGSVTGWFPTEAVGVVFMTLGLSFAIQNLVVARRRDLRITSTARVPA
jgi:hypothetical protein